MYHKSLKIFSRTETNSGIDSFVCAYKHLSERLKLLIFTFHKCKRNTIGLVKNNNVLVMFKQQVTIF